MADHDGVGGYRAFLSYSHKDAGEARWLHRRLESYRLPRRLIGSAGARGPVPARLAPIFRDREELPAGQDLTEQVRAALAASEALVVLCSPAAAASPWVEREIEVFRALHPDRPILAAIVSGDPPLCFPPGLSEGGREPLASDLRKGSDGRRLGFLKLVAGLSGVGLDALVQRDAQRRIRRVTAVTVAAVAAMLVMATLTAIAMTARREAERQRAEAEGLVEFMLTDLRDRLRGVGRLDVMESVNRRALGYYGSRRDLARLSPDSLMRRARILQAIGDDDLNAEDWAGARAAFGEAAEATAEQSSRAPGKPAFLHEHSKSLIGLGRVAEELKDWPRAQRYYAAAAELAERAARTDPGQGEYATRAASTAMDLGNVQLYGTRDYAAAQRSYERAIALNGRALAAKPGDEHILLGQANAYAYLGDSFHMRGLFARSLEARRKQHAIVAALSRSDPKNLDFLFRLAAAERGMAQALARTGDAAAAAALTRKARGETALLVGRDPQNGKWRQLKTLLEADLGRFGSIAVTTTRGAEEQ